MYALILTHDARKSLARLTVESYMKFWPNSPFIFRLAYNEDFPEYTKKYNKFEIIKTKPGIRSTVEKLLFNIEDDEFIYWCFDDCYIHDIINLTAIKKIYKFLKNNKPSYCDSVRFLRFHNEIVKGINKIVVGNTVLKLKKWEGGRFWYHQFIRVRVLKNIFLNKRISDDLRIGQIEKIRIQNSNCRHNVFIPQSDLIVFGETTRGENLTKNCYDSLIQYNIEVPKFKINPGVILNGANVNGLGGLASSVKGKDYLKKYI